MVFTILKHDKTWGNSISVPYSKFWGTRPPSPCSLLLCPRYGCEVLWSACLFVCLFICLSVCASTTTHLNCNGANGPQSKTTSMFYPGSGTGAKSAVFDGILLSSWRPICSFCILAGLYLILTVKFLKQLSMKFMKCWNKLALLYTGNSRVHNTVCRTLSQLSGYSDLSCEFLMLFAYPIFLSIGLFLP